MIEISPNPPLRVRDYIRGRLVVIEGFRNYPILTRCVNQLIQARGGGDVGGVYV
jgi:hypothetical protein